MSEDWLEHVELPDGQSADLLLRYPYERANMIEQARERDIAATQSAIGNRNQVRRMTVTGFTDAVLRASLWSADLKHDLTGERITAEQVGMASDKVIKELSIKAMTNYVAWYDEAYAGPKGSSRTDSQTPRSGKSSKHRGTEG